MSGHGNFKSYIYLKVPSISKKLTHEGSLLKCLEEGSDSSDQSIEDTNESDKQPFYNLTVDVKKVADELRYRLFGRICEKLRKRKLTELYLLRDERAKEDFVLKLYYQNSLDYINQ